MQEDKNYCCLLITNSIGNKISILERRVTQVCFLCNTYAPPVKQREDLREG